MWSMVAYMCLLQPPSFHFKIFILVVKINFYFSTYYLFHAMGRYGLTKVSKMQNLKSKRNCSFPLWVQNFPFSMTTVCPYLKGPPTCRKLFRSNRSSFVPYTKLFVLNPSSVCSPLHWFSCTFGSLYR